MARRVATPSKRALPTGTVTFMFTDIEGSTRHLARLGSEYRGILEAHNEILRAAIESHDGVVVSTDGDAFFAAFPMAPAAVDSAAAVQRSIAGRLSAAGTTVRVRMGPLRPPVSR